MFGEQISCGDYSSIGVRLVVGWVGAGGRNLPENVCNMGHFPQAIVLGESFVCKNWNTKHRGVVLKIFVHEFVRGIWSRKASDWKVGAHKLRIVVVRWQRRKDGI